MGSYYTEFVSDRDPAEECYDWPITGVPGDQLREGGLDSTPDGFYGEERWKETRIPGVWVSNYERFYDTDRGYFLKEYPMKTGYVEVKTYRNHKQNHLAVHRTMAEAFIPNLNNDPYVRHLDDNRKNNELGNLAWGTAKENHLDSVRNGTYVPFTEEDLHKAVEKRSRSIITTDLSNGNETTFKSMHEAARQLNIAVESICNIVNRRGNHKTAGGFTFRSK